MNPIHASVIFYRIYRIRLQSGKTEMIVLYLTTMSFFSVVDKMEANATNSNSSGFFSGDKEEPGISDPQILDPQILARSFTVYKIGQ